MSAPMSQPHRLVSRSLLSVGVLAGLGAAFVVGTSYGTGSGGADPDPWSGGGTDVSPAAYTGSDLSLADSCEELLGSYVERGVDRVGPYGWGYGGPYYYADGLETPLGAVDSVAGSLTRGLPAAVPAPVRATSEGTGTNVQEAGVDEPDVVKTDGPTLFRVQDGDLVVYDLGGDEVRRLTSLDLPGSTGSSDTEILLSGETVVALWHHDRADGNATTELVTVDVSDPSAPAVTHTAEYDTELVTARLHDGVVRVVLRSGLPALDFTQPGRRTTELEATEANQRAVRESEIGDWLPTVTYDGGEAEQLLVCDQVAIPDDADSLGTMAVVGFDAAAPEAPSVTGLAVDTSLAYASTDQLFLATSPMFSGVIFRCFDCLEPMPMPESDGGLLPRWFPGGAGPDTGPAPYTGDDSSHLYAFDLDGIDTTFAASGSVDGVIRDRWSIDAAEGVLRVAVGPNGSTGNFNSLVTFRQEGNDLVESGRLDDLGVGEDIQSVRWFDTLAIVVTFRQIDPLYAVDLTDPDHPRQLGELKIPGFSAYLHPLGQHRLLGLGQGPGRKGVWGAQAGLFNVSDLTHPRRLDVLSYGAGSQALATQDPRQLTWLPDGRTVLSVVAAYDKRGTVGYVSVLTLGDGQLSNRMVEVEYGDEVNAVRLVPLADGRVVLVTGDDASFFDL
jgi:hypothetical protein